MTRRALSILRLRNRALNNSLAGCRRAYASQSDDRPIFIPNKPPTPAATQPARSQQSASKTATGSSSKTAGSNSSASSSAASLLPKPRIDYRAITSDPKSVTLNHVLRNAGLRQDLVFHITRLHDTSLSLTRKLDSLRAKQRDVGNLIKAGGGSDALEQAKKLKQKAAEYSRVLEETDAELLELGTQLPNETHPDTPVGKEDKAVELRRLGPEPIAADPRRDHLDIALRLGWLDPPASALATGSSWPYLKGFLALLEQALVQHALAVAIRRGWTPIATPDVVKEDVMARCGFRPRDPSQAGQTYYLSTADPSSDANGGAESSGLVLAATAEIPLAAFMANKILPHGQLPQRFVGVGKAFRAEAGARGADTRGLYRLHQFTKVELFAITEGDKSTSEAMMNEIGDVQKDVVNALGLTVKVLDMPTEELGASAYRKWDMEAWMPGRGKWGEISSTSNCTDYQARRLHIRHRHSNPSPTDGSLPFVHTLNGTCAAVPRLIIALVENGVKLDDAGQVTGLALPQALKPFWIGGDEFAAPGKDGLKYRIEWQ